MTEVSLLKPVVSLLVDQLNHGKKNSQNQSGYGTALVVSKMIFYFCNVLTYLHHSFLLLLLY